MTTTHERRAHFLTMHVKGAPFIIANAWDAGSARVLASLGFKAIATTSSGFALTKGRRDYGVTRADAISHGATLSQAVDIPVSADLENGFGVSPDDVAKTISDAVASGLAGGSIEDFSGDERSPIIDKTLAVERVHAARDAATDGFVLTARAEAFLYGDANLDDVIARLNAFADAGADVLFAPGLPDLHAVKTVCSSVSKPVNVLVHGELANLTRDDLAAAGAARISLGGALAFQAYAAMAETAATIQETGDFSKLGGRRDGLAVVHAALG